MIYFGPQFPRSAFSILSRYQCEFIRDILLGGVFRASCPQGRGLRAGHGASGAGHAHPGPPAGRRLPDAEEEEAEAEEAAGTLREAGLLPFGAMGAEPSRSTQLVRGKSNSVLPASQRSNALRPSILLTTKRRETPSDVLNTPKVLKTPRPAHNFGG